MYYKYGSVREMSILCQDPLSSATIIFGYIFGSTEMVQYGKTLWEMPEEYLRPSEQREESHWDTLVKDQII